MTGSEVIRLVVPKKDVPSKLDSTEKSCHGSSCSVDTNK